MADRIGRRNFMKLTSLGLVAAVTGSEIIPRINNEVPVSWRIKNGLEVCNELAKAEISNDSQQITDARKLAVIWVFAESSSLFAKDAGMEKAGQTIEHYLYGDGKDLDISPWFDEVVDKKEFWQNSILFAFGRYYESLTGNSNFLEISQEKFLKLFDQLRDRFQKGYTFGGGVETNNESATDWFYAVGRSIYNMKGDVKITPSQGEFLLSLKNMDVRMFDRYDWELGFEVGISDKAKVFSTKITKPLFDHFLTAKENTGKFLDIINFPDEKKEVILTAINSLAAHVSENTNKIPNTVKNIEGWAIQSADGYIREKDMNLLKKIGAQDYNITASFQRINEISILTSSNTYLYRTY